MIYAYAALGIWISLTLITGAKLQEKRIMKCLAFSGALFCLEYYISSIILLWLNLFQVKHVLFVMGSVSCICLIYLWRKGLLCIRNVVFEIKKDVILIVLVFMGILLISGKSEDIRTSADMGMYFQHTIRLMQDDNAGSLEIKEMGEISDEVDEGIYSQFDLLAGVKAVGDKVAYHAVPTWTALAALFGKIGGIKFIAQVLTLFYILASCALYFAAENLTSWPQGKFLTFPLFSFAPLMIYLSKCTLSEMAFIALFVIGVWLLTEKSEYMQYLSISFLGLLGFVHFSAFMYIPVFWLVLFIISIYKNNLIWAKVNVGQTILFVISLLYTYFVSREYVTYQLTMRLSFISNNGGVLVLVIAAGAVLLVILQILGSYFRYKGRITQNMVEWLNDKLNIFIYICVIILVLGTILQGYRLCFTDKYAVGGGTWNLRAHYGGQGLVALSHLNISTMLMATGYVLLPVIFYQILKKLKKIQIEDKGIFLIILYTMALYTFIVPDTPNNYYASRYFAMVLVPMFSLLLVRIIHTKRMFLIAMGIGWLVCIPFDIALYNAIPFGGQMELLEDVLDTIEPEGVVLVPEANDELNLFVNSLRILNDCWVYSYNNKDEVLEYYRDEDIPVYLVSGTKNAELEGNLVWLKEYTIYTSMSKMGGLYPMSIAHNTVRYYIYQLK